MQYAIKSHTVSNYFPNGIRGPTCDSLGLSLGQAVLLRIRKASRNDSTVTDLAVECNILSHPEGGHPARHYPRNQATQKNLPNEQEKTLPTPMEIPSSGSLAGGADHLSCG